MKRYFCSSDENKLTSFFSVLPYSFWPLAGLNLNLFLFRKFRNTVESTDSTLGCTMNKTHSLSMVVCLKLMFWLLIITMYSMSSSSFSRVCLCGDLPANMKLSGCSGGALFFLKYYCRVSLTCTSYRSIAFKAISMSPSFCSSISEILKEFQSLK